jgi:hypothetical protein
MKQPNTNQPTILKPYDKPVWQKQEIFERFTLACGGKVKLTTQSCHQIGS